MACTAEGGAVWGIVEEIIFTGIETRYALQIQLPSLGCKAFVLTFAVCLLLTSTLCALSKIQNTPEVFTSPPVDMTAQAEIELKFYEFYSPL